MQNTYILIFLLFQFFFIQVNNFEDVFHKKVSSEDNSEIILFTKKSSKSMFKKEALRYEGLTKYGWEQEGDIVR